MMAAAKPAIMIPIMINAEFELSLAEKNTIIIIASIAPKKEAIQINQELFIKSEKPKTVDRKITKATPKPEADVIPSTDGSAKGFLNNSCNKRPLTGKAMPLKTAAIVFGNLKFKINCFAF